MPPRSLSLVALVLVAWLQSSCSVTRGLAKSRLDDTEWASYDGKVMPYARWMPGADQPVRAVVIAVHGLSGAKSDFWFLGEHLPASGMAVYAYDLRGQGNDPVVEDRGDIRSGRVWLHDLTTFHSLVAARHPRVPIYWYGESLGSLIVLHAAARRQLTARDPAGVILTSPAAGLRTAISGFRRWLLEAAAALSPRTRYSLGELAHLDESKIQVTSDTTLGGQMGVTPHAVGHFTLRLLAEVGYLLDRNPEAAKKLRMPVLFLASPNDVLSSPDQVQGLFGGLHSARKRLLWYTRSHHLLLHDVQRDEVVQDVTRWIGQQQGLDGQGNPGQHGS